MTATGTYLSGSASLRLSSGALAGFANFSRKDLLEWFRTRRAMWTTLAATALILLGVTAERASGLLDSQWKTNNDPSFNMLNAGWDTMLPIFAVFTTMGILVSERDSRTLAWSLSMPLGRMAVLLSKLLTSVVGLFVCALVIPDVVAVIAVRLVYGGFPSYQSIVWQAVAGGAVALFLIVLNLCVSVFGRGQRTVAAAALIVGMIAPGLIRGFWPAASPWWPISISEWITNFGDGKPMQAISPLTWLAAVVVLATLTCWRFSREEL